MSIKIYNSNEMKQSSFATVLIFMFLISACDLFDSLDENPPHLITTDVLYQDLQGFETGINGLYALVRLEESRNVSSLDAWWVGTDQFATNHRSSSFSEIAEIWGDANNPHSSVIRNNFEWLYEIINASNTIINQAQRDEIDWSGGSADAITNKNRILADAKVIRAYAYRHLTYLYGDVPLSLEESTGGTIRTDWIRSPVKEVREQIISDLLFAEEHIPVNATLAGRVTKGAVQHYLAEMYLVLDGQYPPNNDNVERALYWADEVINTPEYSLITERYGELADVPGIPFMDMFYGDNVQRENGNTEALWVFQWANEVTGGGNENDARLRRKHASRYNEINFDGVVALQLTFDRGGAGKSRFSLTKWAIDLYDPEDDRGSNYALRKFFILKDSEENAPYPADNLPPGYAYGDTLWLDWSQDLTFDTRARNNWPWIRKVDWVNPVNITQRDNFNSKVQLRLANTYLLKAEAQFLLGDLSGAAETINIIRTRSNATEITPAEIDIDFILDERARELAVEEHRRYHLLRTEKWMERTRMYNNNGGQYITERDKLLPIPQSVIDANSQDQPMQQNPGY